MRWDEARDVLDALDRAGVRHWVAGGWGVDVLVGRETRSHRDLDLIVDEHGFDRTLRELAALGYVTETEDLPLRVEVRAAGDRWVDVHPVRFGADGIGVQGDPDGVHFTYPPEAFARGVIAGRTVECLSVAQQLAFHAGYEHRPQDTHDTALLEALRGATVVGLVALCDHVTVDEYRARFAGVEEDQPSGPARPGRHVPDEHDLAVFARDVSFAVVERATLSDGRTITLTDDRGWGTSGPSADDPWAGLTADGIEQDVRNVVLPDDAEDTGDEHPWAWFASILRGHGVTTTADELRRLPYDVVLSDRLLARLDAAANVGTGRRTP